MKKIIGKKIKTSIIPVEMRFSSFFPHRSLQCGLEGGKVIAFTPTSFSIYIIRFRNSEMIYGATIFVALHEPSVALATEIIRAIC